MASSVNRSLLACRYCNTVQEYLHRHLRLRCRKGAAEAEIANIVEEARLNMRKVLESFTIISFKELTALNLSSAQLGKLADFLEKKGSIVTEKHLATQSTLLSADQQGTESNNDGAVCPVLTDIPSTSKTGPTIRTRISRTEYHGRYKPSCPIMLGFKKYLLKSHKHSGIKQIVDNIGRFLYFLDPEKISGEFINDDQKLKQFVMQLEENGASMITIRTYFNAIKHFTSYLTSGNCTAVKMDAKMHMTSQSYLKSPHTISTPCQWQRILQVAKPHILRMMERAIAGGILEEREKTIFLYYLEAIVILIYLHAGSFMQRMTVGNWLERTHTVYELDSRQLRLTIVKVGKDVLVLNKEEEQWFQFYFSEIRPAFVATNNTAEVYFFLSSKGESIKTCAGDLTRLHKKFQLPPVTISVARVAFRKWSLQHLNQEDQQLTKAYLYPNNAKNKLEEIESIRAALLVSTLIGSRVTDDLQEHSEDRINKDAGEVEDTDASANQAPHLKDECYRSVVKAHPAGLHHTIPSAKELQAICNKHSKYCYDRWRREQYVARMDDIIGHFRCNTPSVKQIRSYIQGKMWTVNVPKPEEVLDKWKPQIPRTSHQTQDLQIETLVRSQDWKGLSIVSDSKKGGYAVKASTSFKAGSVICDYHGQLITGQEGEAIQRTIAEGKCYLFFFRDKDMPMCIDGTMAPCPCHPDIPSTYGRLINHSKKNWNLKPIVSHVDNQPVIIFLAKTDILPGTEILYDYGVTRSLFGEGEDLDWLDE